MDNNIALFVSEYFNTIVIIWIGIALVIFPFLLRTRAPYGRHTSSKWGPGISNRAGWFIMELPSLILISVLFLTGKGWSFNILWIFFLLWFIHYFNRIFIYPFRTRTKGKKIPLLIVFFAMFFNLVNGFLNGYWLGYIATFTHSAGADLTQNAGADLPLSAVALVRRRKIRAEDGRGFEIHHITGADWLTDPRLITGLALFLTGFIINQVADNHLIHLRKKNQTGYSIPNHPLFRKISCPNFAGEILEWTGFAIMTWSLPALSFAIWTAVNLIPRALHHHEWYKETFADYPSDRKALIPGVV